MKTSSVTVSSDQRNIERAEEYVRSLGFDSLKDALTRFVQSLAEGRTVLRGKRQGYIVVSDEQAAQFDKDVKEMQTMLRERPKESEKYTAYSLKEHIEKLMVEDE